MSTLEGDIAERNLCLLCQLSTCVSENLALQTRNRSLEECVVGRELDASAHSAKGGRREMNVGISLPPLRMLPDQTAAEVLTFAESAPAATTAIVNTMGLVTNTHKVSA
jgi:hypothetical protein